MYSVWKGERLSGLHLKPYVKQFLDDLGTHFNIGIVTNGKYIVYIEMFVYIVHSSNFYNIFLDSVVQ